MDTGLRLMGLMTLLTLLTIMGLLSIFATIAYRVWTKGVGIAVKITIPQIEVNVPIDLSKLIPTPLVVQIQPLGPDKTIADQAFEAIPENIVEYTEQESDPYWQQARLRRARELKHELGSWDAALRSLQREDNPPS